MSWTDFIPGAAAVRGLLGLGVIQSAHPSQRGLAATVASQGMDDYGKGLPPNSVKRVTGPNVPNKPKPVPIVDQLVQNLQSLVGTGYGSDALDSFSQNQSMGISGGLGLPGGGAGSSAYKPNYLTPPTLPKLNFGDPNKAAQANANATYDPQIEAIRNLMKTTTDTAYRNQQQVGNLYGALQTAIKGDIAPADQRYDQTGQTLSQGIDKSQANINKNFDQSKADQLAQLQHLGIEQAAQPGGVFSHADQQQSFLTSLLENTRAAQQGALALQKNGEHDYLTAQANMAQGEGANRQADIANQLAQTLYQLHGQEGSLTAAKAQAAVSMAQQLLMQQQDMQMKYDQLGSDNFWKAAQYNQGENQFAATNELNQAKLLEDMQAAQLAASSRISAAQARNTTSPYADPYQFVASSLANQVGQGAAPQYMAAVKNFLMNDPNLVKGQQDLGNGMSSSVTGPYVLQSASKFAQANNLDVQAFTQAAQQLWSLMTQKPFNAGG